MNQRDQNAPRARRSETNRRDPADPKDHGNQKNRRETWRTSRAKCRNVEIIRRKDRDGSAGRIAVTNIISCLFWSLVRLARRAKTTAGEKRGGISFQRVVDVNTRDPGLVEGTISANARRPSKNLSTKKCAARKIFFARGCPEVPSTARRHSARRAKFFFRSMRRNSLSAVYGKILLSVDASDLPPPAPRRHSCVGRCVRVCSSRSAPCRSSFDLGLYACPS
jgi:hypothetical protein